VEGRTSYVRCVFDHRHLARHDHRGYAAKYLPIGLLHGITAQDIPKGRMGLDHFASGGIDGSKGLRCDDLVTHRSGTEPGERAPSTSLKAASRMSSACSSSDSDVVSGGSRRTTLSNSPALSTIRPRSSQRWTTVVGLMCVGLSRVALYDELHGDHRAEAADVANGAIPLLSSAHPLQNALAKKHSSLRQSLLPDDVENCKGCGTG
jgi:hypothetical protein